MQPRVYLRSDSSIDVYLSMLRIGYQNAQHAAGTPYACRLTNVRLSRGGYQGSAIVQENCAGNHIEIYSSIPCRGKICLSLQAREVSLYTPQYSSLVLVEQSTQLRTQSDEWRLPHGGCQDSRVGLGPWMLLQASCDASIW